MTGFVHPALSAQPDGLAIQPGELDIGTFYSGGTVEISGRVPDGQDVIVEIEGPVMEGHFNLKKRVGPFWMTRGKADIIGAPAIYALLLPEGGNWRDKASALGLGLEALKKKLSMESDSLSPDKLFNMFLLLKKSEGSYVIEEKAVTYAPSEAGYRRFSVKFKFPLSTATGKYDIKATPITGSGIGKIQTGSLAVDEVGFIRLVDNMATHKRLTYGIFAVLIALFAGSIMGVMFKGGGSH